MIVETKNMKTEELIGALVELDKQGKLDAVAGLLVSSSPRTFRIH